MESEHVSAKNRFSRRDAIVLGLYTIGGLAMAGSSVYHERDKNGRRDDDVQINDLGLNVFLGGLGTILATCLGFGVYDNRRGLIKGFKEYLEFE